MARFASRLKSGCTTLNTRSHLAFQTNQKVAKITNTINFRTNTFQEKPNPLNFRTNMEEMFNGLPMQTTKKTDSGGTQID